MHDTRSDCWSSRLLWRVEKSKEPLNREIGFVRDGIMRLGLGRHKPLGGDDQHTESVLVVRPSHRSQILALNVTKADQIFASSDVRRDRQHLLNRALADEQVISVLALDDH